MAVDLPVTLLANEAAALPFRCPVCGQRFGFGTSAVLISIVRSLPFSDAPLPCCGAMTWGTLVREPDGSLNVTFTRIEEVAGGLA